MTFCDQSHQLGRVRQPAVNRFPSAESPLRRVWNGRADRRGDWRFHPRPARLRRRSIAERSLTRNRARMHRGIIKCFLGAGPGPLVSAPPPSNGVARGRIAATSASGAAADPSATAHRCICRRRLAITPTSSRRSITPRMSAISSAPEIRWPRITNTCPLLITAARRRSWLAELPFIVPPAKCRRVPMPSGAAVSRHASAARARSITNSK